MVGIIVLVIVVVLALALVGMYNGLVTLKNRVDEAWSAVLDAARRVKTGFGSCHREIQKKVVVGI
jgi:hypothetical protein